eukprot:6209415-Pleurochrysis_carterae.AAC.1
MKLRLQRIPPRICESERVRESARAWPSTRALESVLCVRCMLCVMRTHAKRARMEGGRAKVVVVVAAPRTRGGTKPCRSRRSRTAARACGPERAPGRDPSGSVPVREEEADEGECACACACVRMCACARVCTCVWKRESGRVRERAGESKGDIDR